MMLAKRATKQGLNIKYPTRLPIVWVAFYSTMLLLSLLFCAPYSYASNKADVSMYTSILEDKITPLNKRIQLLLESPPRELEPDNKKAFYHMVLSQLYAQATQPSKAIDEAKKSLLLINEKEFPDLFHLSKVTQANALNLVQQGESAIDSVSAAVEWALSSNNQELLAQAQLTLANIYLRGGQFSSARDNALASLTVAKEIGSIRLSSQIAEVLANTYARQGNYELAKKFYIESANYAETAADPIGLSYSLFGLGRMQLFLKEYAESEQSFLRSKIYAEESGDELGVAYALDFLSQLFFEMGNYDKAKDYRLQSLVVFEEKQSVFSERQALLHMVKIAIAQSDLSTALIYYEKGQSHPFQRVGEGFRINEKLYYSQILALQGNYQQAFELLNETVKVKDARTVAARQKMQAEHIKQMESEVRVKENKLLASISSAEKKYAQQQKQQRHRVVILYICVLLISVFFIAWFVSSRRKKTFLLELANTDSLSELANRRRVLELMNHQIALAHRHKTPFTAALLDIDHFKKINDTHGHAAGDAVLKGFGQLCKVMFRHTDIVGRVGGEEFVIGFPHTPCIVAEEALRAFSREFENLGEAIGYPGLSLSISAGAAELESQADAEALIADCDKALYEAKKEGRKQVRLFVS
ncbi:diguanylate cyclase [Glaciecola sp. MH2013]|uniref:tetratricopeptide repeat-containing diguanylate cyclase n=1 Tax=Glaciecola sp. MH2013 TaxID=2785524 RepID=UPI00189E677D|nr:GGDEF domain-containing protein [Glaciecola sp. MH2013]MBF7071979.1 diguanylate cyclase [Glaciecola sp. MH2013]